MSSFELATHTHNAEKLAGRERHIAGHSVLRRVQMRGDFLQNPSMQPICGGEKDSFFCIPFKGRNTIESFLQVIDEGILYRLLS